MTSQNYNDDYARDRAEIEDLMARYLFALDYNDLDSFIEMFTDDAEFEFARGRVSGKANILEAVQGFKKRIGEHYKDETATPRCCATCLLTPRSGSRATAPGRARSGSKWLTTALARA